MNRLVTNIPRTCYPNNLAPGFMSLTELTSIIQNDNRVLVVEIGKAPTSLFKNSLWIGYRNGGMASWLSTLMPHLPFNRFCLYMDETEYTQSDYMYSYYGEYFQKLFHSTYIGSCVHPRSQVRNQNLAVLDEVKATHLPQIFMEAHQQGKKNVLLDLRGAEQAINDPVNHLIPKGITTEYVNLPLNDDDIIELLQQKIAHMPEEIQFITMCAKGYRSLIGYSLMNLIAERSWKIKLCRNTLPEIQKGLSAQSFKTLQAKQNLII